MLTLSNKDAGSLFIQLEKTRADLHFETRRADDYQEMYRNLQNKAWYEIRIYKGLLYVSICIITLLVVPYLR